MKRISRSKLAGIVAVPLLAAGAFGLLTSQPVSAAADPYTYATKASSGVTVDDFKTKTVEVDCPEGYKVTGGGHKFDDMAYQNPTLVLQSRPTSGMGAWVIKVQMNLADRAFPEFTAYAVCALVS
ncbi:hypothetical protein [Streptomyces sp. NPDC051554]|uniref:hypothetical protein n=1 Tax=Streptomyces sp. NPDC051554 TaxID=3365656 RepID=UPI0037950EA1